MSNVTRLLDREPVSVGDQQEMGEWLLNWANAFTRGDYGTLHTVAIVVESDSGQVACVSQSLCRIDNARLVGLLMTAAHKKLDGAASIAGLAGDA